MMLKSVLTLFALSTLCSPHGAPSCFGTAASCISNQCLDRAAEDQLIRTILSEEKHIKGYLTALQSLGRDTIGVTFTNNFSPRALQVHGYVFQVIPGDKPRTQLSIGLSDDCMSGTFTFGDSKYSVLGSFISSNGVWVLEEITMLELN